MMKNLTKIGGVAAVAAALALTGCGGGGATTSAESAKAQDASGDINKLISVNTKKADELKQGGTVTLPVGNIGPDFNGFSNAGNSADNTELHYPIDEAGYVGCWKYDFDGSTKLNTNFCEDFQSEVKDGKQHYDETPESFAAQVEHFVRISERTSLADAAEPRLSI